MQLGVALIETNRPVEAEITFRDLVKRQISPMAYFHLGTALSAQRRYPEAEDAYRYLSGLGVYVPEAYHNLGLLLGQQGKYEDAEIAYRKAILLKPDYSEAVYNLGCMFLSAKKYSQAEAAFRDAIKSGGVEAYVNLAHTLVEERKFAEAEAVARTAIRLKPTYSEAYVNLGRALFLAKEPRGGGGNVSQGYRAQAG